MRDLKADLEAIREGATLFGDPNPGVNTQYELYEVAEHAIERALDAEGALTRFSNSVFAQKARADKAEALARELVEVLEGVQRLKKPLIAYPDDVLPEFGEEAMAIANMLNVVASVISKAKEVLDHEKA